MNKNKEMREAKKHQGEGQCYIKAEDRELLVAGDMVAVLRTAERIITRVGEISGEGFVQTWLSIKDIHNMSEKLGTESEVIQRGERNEYDNT